MSLSPFAVFVFLFSCFLRGRETRSAAHHLLFVLHAGNLAQVQPRRDQCVPVVDLAPFKAQVLIPLTLGEVNQFGYPSSFFSLLAEYR